MIHPFTMQRIIAHREEAWIKVQQRHKHKHQQDSATQLHVLFRRALSHSGNPSKHTPALRARLCKQQQQPSPQSQIPETQRKWRDQSIKHRMIYSFLAYPAKNLPHQKLWVPENAIGNSLEQIKISTVIKQFNVIIVLTKDNIKLPY